MCEEQFNQDQPRAIRLNLSLERRMAKKTSNEDPKRLMQHIKFAVRQSRVAGALVEWWIKRRPYKVQDNYCLSRHFSLIPTYRRWPLWCQQNGTLADIVNIALIRLTGFSSLRDVEDEHYKEEDKLTRDPYAKFQIPRTKVTDKYGENDVNMSTELKQRLDEFREIFKCEFINYNQRACVSYFDSQRASKGFSRRFLGLYLKENEHFGHRKIALPDMNPLEIVVSDTESFDEEEPEPAPDNVQPSGAASSTGGRF